MSTSDLALIRDAAREAASIAMGYFRQDPDVWYKDGTSPVSEADIAVKDYLQETLGRSRPDYGWLSEESADDMSRLGGAPVFVVDPLDGTRGFVSGQDKWCVSIGVVHDGVPQAGVLACPARDEYFEAAIGSPAMKNGQPISVSTKGFEGRVAAPKSIMKKLSGGPLAAIVHEVYIPSLAYRLAMVADGRLSATLVKANANDWDIAAADIILRQAGGSLVDMNGNAPGYDRATTRHDVLIAAANGMMPTLKSELDGVEL